MLADLTPPELACECVRLGSQPEYSGPTTEIWKGRWLDKQDVALIFYKEYRTGLRDDDAIQRFGGQIGIWRRLNSPFVLRLYGWCKLDGETYLVSPWLRNRDVVRYLDGDKGRHQKCISLVYEIAQGLRYLHNQNIIHGSLKPSNILVQDDGRACLSDFSLAKLATPDAKNTQLNPQVNSFRYQAPEVILDKPISTASDVYSWAMTALEIITGFTPFYMRSTPGQLLEVIMKNLIPTRDDHKSPVLDKHPEIWDMFVRCWSREPADRPTAKKIVESMEMIMEGPKNAPLDFAAAGVLQGADLEKRRDQERTQPTLHSWSLSTSQSPTPISLPEELTRLDHDVTPATGPLILLLQALGREAPKTTRHKHKVYAIIVRARDVCNHILAIGTGPEFNGLDDLDEYYNMIDALEGVLLRLAQLLPAEQVTFGPEMCASWSENQNTLITILDKLHRPPFNFDLPSSEQEYAKNTAFDACYWLSLLLHEGIEQELGRRYSGTALPPDVASVQEALHYLENEIKRSYSDDATRELVIDIATRLYESLAVPAPKEDKDTAFPIRFVRPPTQIQGTEDSLVTQLSETFSSLDLESSLQPLDVQALGERWQILSAPGSATLRGMATAAPAMF
ncbi:hypothetical protein M407DRAFT_110082 [Tulasnella calospora MUT 4182]|uniref:Protein kinase domain-containing protein n=1 Tax=Tulasnella calospora MUT 4182 TaxID=1051891 RepID=A0A0C3QEF0_9AGAM|nr:hypothetical protein M407DRAFT_110082 [Tulasnella calospora MUT 4182]